MACGSTRSSAWRGRTDDGRRQPFLQRLPMGGGHRETGSAASSSGGACCTFAVLCCCDLPGQLYICCTFAVLCSALLCCMCLCVCVSVAHGAHHPHLRLLRRPRRLLFCRGAAVHLLYSTLLCSALLYVSVCLCVCCPWCPSSSSSSASSASAVLSRRFALLCVLTVCQVPPARTSSCSSWRRRMLMSYV